MSQVNPGDFPIDPQVTSGTQLAEILNRWFNAQNSQNSGATAPTTTFPGMFWYDTSVSPAELKVRNATNSAWVSFAASIGIENDAGQVLLDDGAIGVPSLAFKSDLTMGMFKKAVGVTSFVRNAKEVLQLGASANSASSLTLLPQVAGTTSIVAANYPAGAGSGQNLTMWINSSSANIGQAQFGGAAKLPMIFAGATRYTFDNEVHFPGSGGGIIADSYYASSNQFVTNLLSANPNWGAYVRLVAILVTGQWAGFNMNTPSGSYIDFKLSDPNAAQIFLAGGSSLVQASRFVGQADSANYANSTAVATKLAAGANTGNQWMIFNWSDPGGQRTYLWGGDDGTNMYLTHRNNLTVGRADRVNSVDGASGGNITSQVNFTGGPTASQIAYDIVAGGNFKSNKSSNHWWRWHWNGDVGDNHLYAFVDDSNMGWATLNSDARLKEDITPLVSDTAAFMRLEPVNYRWKKVGAVTSNDRKNDGLIAQNVRDCFPMAAFGDFDTPPKEDGTMDFPGSVDDRAMIAHCIAQVQKLINFVKMPLA